ncbi:MAG: DNA-processing protein DprA [Eubacterium sp.]|nr:DNA-processing protein DprA [Eubacterium sp.]
MTDKRYWIWMQLGVGAGADTQKILDFFETPKKLYDASVLEWAACDGINATRLDNLAEVSLEDADRVISTCENNGWDILIPDDERYPESLRDIPKQPAVLYVAGDIDCVKDRLVVGMVGTRKASAYSLKAARFLAKGIADCGAVIASGGALGVDSASHEGALQANGTTVAVLGCGLGSDYLKSNEKLRSDIVKNGGALITEFPPYTRADRTTFPIRNRIISGLSRCVIVVEAAQKSGSLITAEYARAQGRDIFAVPSSILDPDFQGTNKLIDEGAFVATGPAAVINRYRDDYFTLKPENVKTMYDMGRSNYGANAPEKRQITFDSISKTRDDDAQRSSKSVNLVGVEREVYDAIGDSLVTLEEIAAKTGIDSSKVITTLTVLEIQGLILKAEGDRYSQI